MNFLDALESGLPFRRSGGRLSLRHMRDGKYVFTGWIDGVEVGMGDFEFDREDYLAEDWAVQLEDGTETDDAYDLPEHEEEVPGIWLPSSPSPLDDHAAQIRLHMAYLEDHRRMLVAGNQSGKLMFSRLSDPAEVPEVRSLRAETVKDLIHAGLISPDQVHGLMSMPWMIERSGVVQRRTGFQVIGPSCPGHERVDTGMTKSWCRHCNANMAMVGLEWKVIP